MKAKLSTRIVNSLSSKIEPYEVVDTDLKGFLLRIQPTGKKTFYYSYRNDQGKRKRIKIGALDSSLTIQQARDQAVRFAANVVAGKDIQAEKTDTRQKENEKKQVKKSTNKHQLN